MKEKKKVTKTIKRIIEFLLKEENNKPKNEKDGFCKVKKLNY